MKNWIRLWRKSIPIKHFVCELQDFLQFESMKLNTKGLFEYLEILSTNLESRLDLSLKGVHLSLGIPGKTPLVACYDMITCMISR